MTEPQTAPTHAPEENGAAPVEPYKPTLSAFVTESMAGRILAVILLTAFLPSMFVGWLGYTAVYNEDVENKMHDVGLVASIRHDQLISALNGVTNRAVQLLEINLARCNALFGPSTPQTESCLRSALTIFVAREKAAGATLHRPQAGDLAVGAFTAGSPDSWKLQPGQLAIFPPAKNQSDRVYHVPVTDPQTQSRLVMTYPVGLLQDIFVPQHALGNSGETFLADSKGFFITKPRYKSAQGHSMAISAVPMQTCLQQKDMEMLELDYRAVPIIHGFRYVPEIGGGCIMAHFDQQEAFAPLDALKHKLFAITLAIGLLAVMAAFYLARQITRPLNTLNRTVGSIEYGTEAIEISERGPIEVVSLARSFNLMLGRLGQAIGKLNLSMSELKQANTKLEETQSHLMQSERALNDAQQLAHIGSWERNLMTDSLICSEEIFRILEIDPAHTDIAYEEFILTVHPEDREMVDRAYMTCIQTREPFDITHRLLLSNGRVKWVNERGTFYYDTNGVPLRSIGTIQDITERKLADDMLRVVATTFETHEGIMISDAHANIIRVNQAFHDITGYSQEEVLGKNPRILSSGHQDKAFYAAMWQQLLNTGSWTGELWNRRKNGQVYPEWLTITAVKNERGETTEYIAIFSDITERKQAEDAVRKSNDLLQSVVENVPARIFWKDRDSRYLGCNTQFAKDAGCSSPGELTGTTDFDMGWKNQAELYRADDRDVMESGNPKLDYEEPQTTPDGNMIWLRTSKVPLRDRSNRVIGILGIYEDITERKQAEERLRKYNEELEAINHQLQDTQNQLLQSEKMASIGQLAAGVAHEINNPIGYVYSNLGTLEKYVQDAFGMLEQYEQAEGAIGDEAVRARLKAARDKLDIEFLKDDLRALMNESKDGITRVKKIVQNLKDFSHVDTSDEWHFADLHKGLESTLNIVSNEIKYKADVVREYGDLPEVECLSSQLNQVFMNLLVNAAHAIEERGTITVRTGKQEEDVWVEIADTGKGIAPEHLKKIFDPFFTTKPIGKGTGLGLSLSYSIIQKHHGRIEVQSEPGKGTAFRVWLPVRQPQDEQA